MVDKMLKIYEVEYNSNNSGGSWWLRDEDWTKLEKEGWKVNWVKDDPHMQKYQINDRWLGALATSATIKLESYSTELAEGLATAWWEEALGYDAYVTGCTCCGQPHNFYASEKK